MSGCEWPAGGKPEEFYEFMVFSDGDGDDVKQWDSLDDEDDCEYISLLKWLRCFWMGADDRRVFHGGQLSFLVSEVRRVPDFMWTCRVVVWECRGSMVNTVVFRLKGSGEEA